MSNNSSKFHNVLARISGITDLYHVVKMYVKVFGDLHSVRHTDVTVSHAQKSKKLLNLFFSNGVCPRRNILLFSVFLHVMFANFEIICFLLGASSVYHGFTIPSGKHFQPFLTQVSFKCTTVRKL